jgi:hypothetical protein
MNPGVVRSIKEWWSRRTSADDQLLGLDFILAEMRRARRFNVPFSVAYFSPITHPSTLTPDELASRIYPELREFDYVAVNDEGSFIALWMFGTPRDGAIVKARRLKSSPILVDVLSRATVGVATFPADGMTYEALMEAAQAEAAATQPRSAEQVEVDGSRRWQPSLPNTST